MTFFYLAQNGYIDFDGSVTDAYREAAEAGVCAALPPELQPLTEGIHALVQTIYDPDALNDMLANAHEPKVKDNPLNENFFKQEFQELWRRINQRYSYLVDFSSSELIDKAVKAINEDLIVATLQYTKTAGEQVGTTFERTGSKTEELDRAMISTVPYDLIGKVAQGASLTRQTTAGILSGIEAGKLAWFRKNPEEFIRKTIDLIEQQKAAVIVEHITYNPSAEEPFSADIFNMSRASQEYEKAYQAKRAIQDYVFTDGTSAQSVERKFAEDMDIDDNVVVFAKLPRGPKGYFIPTPVGNYSPDWAIAFRKGSVKHVFFIAETKGTMDSANIHPIERSKIKCARRLFNEISTAGVKYHDVDSYKTLFDVIATL